MKIQNQSWQIRAFWQPVLLSYLAQWKPRYHWHSVFLLLPITNHSEDPNLERHTLLVLEERTEAELVALALAGDSDAFMRLIEQATFMAQLLAFRFINNRETVREVLQEATAQAFLSLGRLRDAACFRTWFSGIVLNLCRTWLREQSSRQVISLEVLAERSTPPFPLLVVSDPYEVIEEQELRRLVQEAIAGLSPASRSVVWLFYYEQMSIQEIASELMISPSAVKNRLYQGRKELRRQMVECGQMIVLERSRENRLSSNLFKGERYCS
jgi:RNA polymerase sigma factor (sigma-70 family)